MKEKRMSVSRKQNCRWLFPVLLLAFLTGIVIPVKAYVQGYAQFSIRPVQILPTIATCFIVILALGTGIGLLILNWQRVKQRLGDYWLLAIGAFVALVFIVFAQNRLPGPALLFTGLLAGLLVRKWEHKYVYLIYGTALVTGIAAFVQNKYPLLTVFVWGAVAGMMLNQKLRPIDVYTDVVFGLALAIGLQVLLCNTGLEALSNSQPNWNNQSSGAVLSLHLWGLCLILPSVLRLIDAGILDKAKQWGSVTLTAAVFIAFVVFLAKTDLQPVRIVTKDDEFVLSEDENVVVFLVDSLDAQYAEDYVLAEDMRPKDEEEEAAEELSKEELFEKWLEATRAGEPFFEEEEEQCVLDESLSHALLDDFTYFDNVVSGAGYNAVSVPTLLTGVQFAVNPDHDPNYGWDMYSRDLERYYEDAYAGSTLFSDLIENGYSVRFYTNSNFVKGMDVGQIDNVRTDVPFRQKSFGVSLGNMLRLTAYYAAPYQAKRAFWISSNDIAGNTEMATSEVKKYGVWDPSFYQDFIEEGLNLENGRKDFVVYHLGGANAPYRMDENCNAVNEADTSLSQQVAGVFRMIDEYVMAMKEKGVYDNSTIIIAGANGDLELGQNPAVFIKRRNENRHFTVDSTPLTFANLRASFVDGIVEKPLREYGYNMFNQPEDKTPVLRKHITEGRKWRRLYSEDAPEWRTFMITDVARGQEHILKTVETEPYPYELGTWIAFVGEDAMIDDFPITGMRKTDAGEAMWTLGHDITMSLDIGATANAIDNAHQGDGGEEEAASMMELPDIIFEMPVYDTLAGTPQRVSIYVNDELLYNETISGPHMISFVIPNELAPDGVYNFVMKLPDATTPKELGINEDGSILGLHLTGFTLYTMEDHGL